MFLRLMDSSPGPDMYSFGCIKAKLPRSRYLVKYRKEAVEIQFKQHLEIGSWVRFYGKKSENYIKVIYLEVLHNIDINLLVAAVSTLENNRIT